MLSEPVLNVPQQATIGREVTLEGIGMHTGKPVKVTFAPAPENSGIRFRRTDLPGQQELAVDPLALGGGVRGTNLGAGESSIHTIEHLTAACHALGVDNLLVMIGGCELPALDGSSRVFAETLQSAAIAPQSSPRKTHRVIAATTYSEGLGNITALPHDTFKVSFTLKFDNPVVGCQFAEYELDAATLVNEILPSRTFCLLEEVEGLRKANLALGGSLENAVVVDSNRILNDSLRFPDEFVRHKILDLVGDLATLGGAIRGHFVANRTGHRHNLALLREMIEKRAIETVDTSRTQLDVEEIRRILPHRFPFLMVDRITEMVPGVKATGLKNVTVNEPFFTGHFPGRCVMPGVLIMEAIAQVAGVCILSLPEHRGRTPFFTGLDSVHFRRTVVPGDQLLIETEIERIRGKMGRIAGRALVESKVAAEGILKFTVM